MDQLHAAYVMGAVTNRDQLPDDFKYFGVKNNNKLNLQTILKHNPLFGMHLTSIKLANGTLNFEINSYVGLNGAQTLYSRLVNSGNTTFTDRVLVNARFDANLELISIAGYTQLGELRNGLTESDLCGYLTNSILFAAQCIHSTMHIHNTILVTALYVASTDSAFISDWSSQFYTQILVKDWQVQTVLLSEKSRPIDGLLTLNDEIQVC